ncbi:MAG: hypothetical protein HC851_22655 [Acaryochloris sp. RU_4_1]|nr:hypothetical protein [Acaryochloris sp. RU_4_1]
MALRWGSQVFRSGWRAGILLLIVGVLFWLTIGLVHQQVLSQSRSTATRLQATGQHQVELSLRLTIVSIDAEIDRTTRVSEVSIRTVGSLLEEMEFKFPVTEFAAIEQAIAKELGLESSEIRNLIRYRINR